MKPLRFIFLFLAVWLVCFSYVSPALVSAATPYTHPSFLTSLPFGTYSHWLQPWRAELETVPAHQFLNGIGINFNVNDTLNANLLAEMLAKHGIRRARVEIGWGEINYEDEARLNRESSFRQRLRALQQQGIRPLILLNAHHGLPGPITTTQRTLSSSAPAGATEIELTDVSGLKPSYSGLSNQTEYWAAAVLITKIDGHRVTLSKPLPQALNATTPLEITTLKYRPFSPPGTSGYQETMAGWRRYVDTVTKFVADALGTTSQPDKGFDLEIWNELTFGSNFLDINRYYQNRLFEPFESNIWDGIAIETAAYAQANPDQFSGVQISNGFGNTIPWIAAERQHPRIQAISKHPYAERKTYPQDESRGTPINALLQPYDPAQFRPTYSALFPEYFGTALQTETMIRDLATFPTDIQGNQHGRLARTVGGKVLPTPVWITEVNLSPMEDNPEITVQRALDVKAKTTARYFAFFLNKGVTQLYLYTTVGDDKGDRGLGLVRQDFLNYVSQLDQSYPPDDDPFTSPALAVLGRMVAQMQAQLDPALNNPRTLQVLSVRDTHNHVQFRGNGTPEFPDLYNRDVFTFLPYQVNAKRFVIPYYVMTRDVKQSLPPEQFSLQVKGLNGAGATITAYDPINDRNVPVTVNQTTGDTISLTVTATDYPYLLIVQEP